MKSSSALLCLVCIFNGVSYSYQFEYGSVECGNYNDEYGEQYYEDSPESPEFGTINFSAPSSSSESHNQREDQTTTFEPIIDSTTVSTATEENRGNVDLLGKYQEFPALDTSRHLDAATTSTVSGKDLLHDPHDQFSITKDQPKNVVDLLTMNHVSPAPSGIPSDTYHIHLPIQPRKDLLHDLPDESKIHVLGNIQNHINYAVSSKKIFSTTEENPKDVDLTENQSLGSSRTTDWPPQLDTTTVFVPKLSSIVETTYLPPTTTTLAPKKETMDKNSLVFKISTKKDQESSFSPKIDISPSKVEAQTEENLPTHDRSRIHSHRRVAVAARLFTPTLPSVVTTTSLPTTTTVVPKKENMDKNSSIFKSSVDQHPNGGFMHTVSSILLIGCVLRLFL